MGSASPGPTTTPPEPHRVDAKPFDGVPTTYEATGPEVSAKDELVAQETALLDAPKPQGETAKSEAVNGHLPANSDMPETQNTHDSPTHSHERPAKRRRTRDATPPSAPGSARKPKPISPPWKKVAAEGPSSFNEGGRRKSGRINAVPLELQPGDKRITRRAVQAPAVNGHKPTTNGHHPVNSHTGTTTTTLTTTAATITAAAAVTTASSNKPTPSSHSRYPRRAPAEPTPSSSSRTRRHIFPSPSAQSTTPSRTQTARAPAPARDRRSRAAAALTPTPPTRSTPRIRLRTGTGSRARTRPLLAIPIVHPDQIKLRPRLATSLEEYFFGPAADIPVEAGGLLAPAEDGPRITEEMAAAEAAVLVRIEQETLPGGLLTAPRCTAFEPEPAEEPPRQWAHRDHLVRAATQFRRLMVLEQQRHRAAAKKLAEACREEWLRRQPKSAEQIEAEARALWAARYRIVVRALLGTWDNVRAEVNRRRLVEWEAAEQRRVKAALQQAVALSEQKLQARRVKRVGEGEDGEEQEEEDEDDDASMADGEEDDISMSDDGNGSGSDGDGDNDSGSDGDLDESMSSSDEDEVDGNADAKSDISDEALTQAQLQQKYANLPDLEKAGDGEKADNDNSDGIVNATAADADADANANDTSDESVDMDDDLGSTDMDDSDDEETASGSDDDEQSESEDDDGSAGGLLGMLFGKAELKKLKRGDEQMVEAISEAEGDLEMKDAPQPDANPASAETETQIQPRPTERPDTPETDAVTTAASLPSRSPSQPRTSDTKPTDVETPRAEAEEDSSPEKAMPPEPEGQSRDSRSSEKAEPVEATTLRKLPSPQSEPVGLTASIIPTSTSTATAKTTLRTEIPFLLHGTLREYQHYGLDWLAGLYANNTNGILADEMGLGKTIQTIALLAHLACHHHVWGPHLVIVPTSVILNWEMEFKKWCPAFKILTYYGTQEERKRKRTGWSNDDVWNVCITSYQIVVQDQQVFKRRRWHYMILDEAHNIKNFKSQRWQSLLGFNTRARLLLTGTPLQNNLTELWSLLFFLMPPENGMGGFAGLDEFHDWFHKPESQILESGREQMDEEARAIIGKLHQVLRPYLLRRLKADVERQMPAKVEHVELCRLSKRQRELYDGFLARADTRATLANGNYLSIINCLMQLRKVCNHPDLFVDRPIMTSLHLPRSVPGRYHEDVVERLQLYCPSNPLTTTVDLRVLNLVPTVRETELSALTATRIEQLASRRPVVLAELRDAQRVRVGSLDAPTAAATLTVQSNLACLENAMRWRRLEELQHQAYINALRRQQRPIFGRGLIDLLTLHVDQRPFTPRPPPRAYHSNGPSSGRLPARLLEWFENESHVLRRLVQPLPARAAAMEPLVSRFACVTPAVVAWDMTAVMLGRRACAAFTDADLRLAAPVKTLPFMTPAAPRDPWHEARMRLSIQFPDKRLLQYDCGKLQALDRLLRRLQAGGHRALIFTQMTRVLDILEQFLNIHGHKYLRLDGATKIEQRQVLTDRFNHDNRILCFILSTRSGGLGINLTGADTVIFYDQDWNPAMDKQCQDRCHRIGQTRDVHIYRLVSEHTIEANILRKASQKQMLDDVVIQEGAFTTDYFTTRAILADSATGDDGIVAATANDNVAAAAMDRVLGGVEAVADPRTAGRVLEQAEDREDVTAARLAEKEILQDDADFGGGVATAATAAATPVSGDASRQGTEPREAGLGGPLLSTESSAEADTDTPAEVNAWGDRMHTIDDYMLAWMAQQLQGTALDLPKDKKRGKKKKGKDTRKR